MKYYLAYGSNLNKEQMQKRCPGAVPVTAEILGKEDFTAEDFDASIDHILGGSYHELTFVMKDGSEITRKWKNQKGAEKCQEK